MLSVSFEEGEIRLLLVKRKKIRRWEKIEIPEGIIRDGIIREPFELGFYLKEALRERKIKERDAMVGVPSIQSFLHMIRIPKVKKGEIKEVIRREAKKEFPIPIEEGRLFPIPLPEERGFLRFMLLLVHNEQVGLIMDALRSAGLKAVGLELALRHSEGYELGRGDRGMG